MVRLLIGFIVALTAQLTAAAAAPEKPPLPQVFQRATMMEEAQAKGEQPLFSTGKVVWQVVKESQSGKPPTSVLRARVEIPDRRLTMTLSMQPNADPTFSASHLIEVRFSVPNDFSGKSITNVPGLIMKPNEQATGSPLVGASAKISANVFWFALAAGESGKQHNLALLRDSGWMSVPIVYESGKRGLITIEKVGAGDRALADAVAAWSGVDKPAVKPEPPVAGPSAPADGKADAATRVLQQRLADAKCYTGPIDGRPNADTEKAKKACPDQEPMLRIETGMHTEVVRDLALDAACSTVATTSDDKTVRLWSLPDGALKRTIRAPLGPSNEGSLRAVALSPDGHTLVTGGTDPERFEAAGNGLYLINLRSDEIMRIGNYSSSINKIEFSPDATRIAVSLAGHQGIRVIDVRTNDVLLDDRNYRDSVTSAVFGPGNSLYAISSDGFIHRYDEYLVKRETVRLPGGLSPVSLAISKSLNHIAVGYSDTSSISIFGLRDLIQSTAADTSGVYPGGFLGLAWADDGKLWAGGRVRSGRFGLDRFYLRQFDRDGSKAGDDVPVATNTVRDIGVCGSSLLFATAEPSLGVVDLPSVKVTQLRVPVTSDMRDKSGYALSVSSDAAMVRFGLLPGEKMPVVFDLAAGTLQEAPQLPEGLHAPRAVSGLEIMNWYQRPNPSLNGIPIRLFDQERALALSVRADDSGFVLGADSTLRAFDSDGRSKWMRRVSAAWGVSLARDGNLVIAALGDGTIRWYRWLDGKELLALFVHKPDRRWVAWTPTGYYMASPGGEDLIGWHVNRGWEQSPDFFPASRFRDRFSRPDIVQRVLTTLDEDKAVAEANTVADTRVTAKPIEAQLPPVVGITSPKDGTSFTGGTVTLDASIRSPSSLPVDRIDVLIDGRSAPDARGVSRSDLASCDLRTVGRAGSCRLTVTLPPKSVNVSLIARAGTLVSEPATIGLTYVGAPPVPDAMKPKLYLLAVGVADYVDPNRRLGLAGKDALDFARVMEMQKGGLYGDVVVKRLIDRDVTRDSLIDGLDWLARSATSKDIVIAFLAGHGIVDSQGKFYFLPADVGATTLKSRGVSKEDIVAPMATAGTKAILFLDTCHSAVVGSGAMARGDLDMNAVINDFASAENGLVVFASATGKELALEDAAWGNGAFTKALLEGLGEGKADLRRTGRVTTAGLGYFVAERVKELTGGRQHPILPQNLTNLNMGDVPLALVRP